jgi:hypothetical protein
MLLHQGFNYSYITLTAYFIYHSTAIWLCYALFLLHVGLFLIPQVVIHRKKKSMLNSFFYLTEFVRENTISLGLCRNSGNSRLLQIMSDFDRLLYSLKDRCLLTNIIV